MGIKRQAEAGGEIAWEEMGGSGARGTSLGPGASAVGRAPRNCRWLLQGAAHRAGRRTGSTTTETGARSSA